MKGYLQTIETRTGEAVQYCPPYSIAYHQDQEEYELPTMAPVSLTPPTLPPLPPITDPNHFPNAHDVSK